MRERLIHFFVITAIGLGLLAVHSCTLEYKIAQEYKKNPLAIQLLFIPPSNVYKFNHKGELIGNFSELSPEQQDSALFYSSRYIQFIDDSIFLESYINRFVDELRLLNFTVHIGAKIDSFIPEHPQTYLLNLSQIQLDEYFYPYEDQEYFFDTLFYKTIYLNAIDFSCWYELNKFDAVNQRKTVLFSENSMFDDFDGNFLLDPLTGAVKYRYHIDSISTTDIYKAAGSLGKIHAGYLYDFFMNQYIVYHFPTGETPQYYYHYNHSANYLSPVEDYRFEILNE